MYTHPLVGKICFRGRNLVEVLAVNEVKNFAYVAGPVMFHRVPLSHLSPPLSDAELASMGLMAEGQVDDGGRDTSDVVPDGVGPEDDTVPL